MSNEETIAELNRQIGAYEATVHNLRLKNEALQEAIAAKDDLISSQKDYLKQIDERYTILRNHVDSLEPAIKVDGVSFYNIYQLEAAGASVVQALSQQKPMGTSVGQADAAIKNAAPQQEVQEPVAWRLWDDEPGETPRWVYYDMSDFKEGINPESFFDGLNPLFDKPQPAPSIGAEVRKQDEALIRQMLEAIEKSSPYLDCEKPLESESLNIRSAAIAAARARLGEGGA